MAVSGDNCLNCMIERKCFSLNLSFYMPYEDLCSANQKNRKLGVFFCWGGGGTPDFNVILTNRREQNVV